MPYLRSYQYQGDPFLGGIIKTLAKPLTSLVARVIKPKTAVGKFLGAVGLGGAATAVTRRVAQVVTRPGVGTIARRVGGAVGLGGAFAAGEALVEGQLGAGGNGCPSGFHPAKDRSGRCVRNRQMNPANPRALRRAIRREEGFVSLARRVGMVPRMTSRGRKLKGRKR